MRIIIVGCGKVGTTIARHLSQEGNDITLIDRVSEAFDKVVENLDVQVIKGNGLSARTLREASVRQADLIIAVTSSDETNILCCLTAKQLGAKHTIARVRDPEYATDLTRFRYDLDLDLIINPEQQAALEISRLLRFPNADNIETFFHGLVELVSFKIGATSKLLGQSLLMAFSRERVHVLVAAVERDGELIIPHGAFVFAEGDVVRVMGTPSHISEFFVTLGQHIHRASDVMIIGGGMIAHYLAMELLHEHTRIKIIEIDRERCEQLSELLPDCTIIHGDGSDEDLLDAEDIEHTAAVVCLTSSDEENAIIGLYAMSRSVSKAVVKVTHINPGLVRKLGLSSIVTPQSITANEIVRYVRGLQNSADRSAIQTMYRITTSEGVAAEALEFVVHQSSRCVGVPLKDLSIKRGILVGSIVHQNIVLSPTGLTKIAAGDTVIIIAKDESIAELDDILITLDDETEQVAASYGRARV